MECESGTALSFTRMMGLYITYSVLLEHPPDEFDGGLSGIHLCEPIPHDVLETGSPGVPNGPGAGHDSPIVPSLEQEDTHSPVLIEIEQRRCGHCAAKPARQHWRYCQPQEPGRLGWILSLIVVWGCRGCLQSMEQLRMGWRLQEPGRGGCALASSRL